MTITHTIARKPNRPQAALDWFQKSGITPSAINKLEVRAEGDASEIHVIGSIGKSWWDDSGVSEQEFRAALAEIPKGKNVTIKINSEGGSVQDGLGIYNAIKDRAADVTCVISGYALSIASVFPLAAGKVVSPKSALWMIHCAWSFAQGNAADMRKSADMLDAHDETLMDIYASATGKSKKELRAAMETETWIKGSDAVAWGLADEGDPEESTVAASAKTAPGAMPVNAATSLNQSPATPPANNQNQQPPKKMNEPTPPAAAPTAASNGDALAQVQTQLANERRARVTDKVTRLAENRIKNDNLKWWIDAAMNDEAGVVAQIEAMPVARNGSDPLGAGVIDLGISPVLAGWGEKPTPMIENIFKNVSGNGVLDTQQKRYNEIRANFPAILAEAARKDGVRPGVFGANTYSSTLTTSFLILGATTKLSPKFAAIKAFSRDVSTDPYKPLATGVMKFTSTLQDGSTAQTNPTDWENTNSTVDAVSISVNRYSNGGSITAADLNNGIRMEDITQGVLMGLGSKVMQAVLAPVTTANFTAAPLVAGLDPNAFGFSETRQLYAKLKYANTRNLILDTEYTAGLLNQPTFFQKANEQQNGPGHWTNVFGWDNVFENTEWSGAGANIHGLACDPQAIGVIAGLPMIDGARIPGGILSTSSGVIAGADLPILVKLWFSTRYETYWFSFDTMLGAAKLDATAGVVIKNQ